MRKPLVLALAAASLGGVALASPASAACGANPLDQCSGNTTVAFAVLPDVGSISIVATPAAVGVSNSALAPVSTGTDSAKSVAVPLGVTTVLDGRTTSSGWTVSASANSGFTLAGGSSPTVAASKATFSVPAAPTAASATLLTGALTGAGQSSISSRATSPVSSGSAIVTSNSSTINAAAFLPQLNVDVTGAAAGLYTGTVTQSVS
ncbi:MAG: hypothetical protein QOE05_2867 [Actinomycetota bacterium]|jgi:hypothetical protein|nr:hypothetical protein [Actinomycetota bacterium]